MTAELNAAPDTKLIELLSYIEKDSVHEPFFREIVHLAINMSRTGSVIIGFFGTPGFSIVASAGNVISYERGQLLETLVRSENYIEIEDTLRHSHYKFNAQILEVPVIRFLAGMPIIDSEGSVIGAIGLADTKPRKFSGEQIQSLGILSRLVTIHLGLKEKLYKL
ncbi:GAF domain-containing protein [Ohtaekwangia sp.]|uniref:GAF domain-containing protein n=1 Tax=Ohtaekwangia sp. TaxID=2066019 RepID=UPI002F9528E3